MNPRKYITDPKILLEEGKAIMTYSDESKYQLRVFAVIMVLSGHSAEEIGEICGYTKAAVTGWVRSVDKYGFESFSPDLNPIEQVWRITRRENTHNRFFPDLKTLESTVESAFEAWSKPNTQLASLRSF